MCGTIIGAEVLFSGNELQESSWYIDLPLTVSMNKLPPVPSLGPEWVNNFLISGTSSNRSVVDI